MVKLSVTSKLDGIKSWSLPAGSTCPGARNASVCTGCYAKSGNYRYPNVKAPREFNMQDWKREEWVDDMVQALQNERFFRWFDSGDMYKRELIDKISEVCRRTNWVTHWVPTQSWDIVALRASLEVLGALPNVTVRASAKHVDHPVLSEKWSHSSVVLSSPEKADQLNVIVCKAYANDGMCGSCRSCYDKSIQTIGYVAHGVSMKKHIRLTAV